MQVGCKGLANSCSKTRVLFAEGQTHGEQREIRRG